MIAGQYHTGTMTNLKRGKNLQNVPKIVRSNRRITIRELIEKLSISYGYMESILTEDLEMTQMSAKFVPRLLSDNKPKTVFYFFQIRTSY